ncbi:hypothetical protein LTS18_005643, partial [Coniosporium uncinatum]
MPQFMDLPAEIHSMVVEQVIKSLTCYTGESGIQKSSGRHTSPTTPRRPFFSQSELDLILTSNRLAGEVIYKMMEASTVRLDDSNLLPPPNLRCLIKHLDITTTVVMTLSANGCFRMTP